MAAPHCSPSPVPSFGCHPEPQGPQGLPPSRVEKAFQQLLGTGSQDDGRERQPSTSRRIAVRAHASRSGTTQEPGTGVLFRPGSCLCHTNCPASQCPSPLSALLEHCVFSWLGPGKSDKVKVSKEVGGGGQSWTPDADMGDVWPHSSKQIVPGVCDCWGGDKA